jgi:SAM-dependent methyltransferase
VKLIGDPRHDREWMAHIEGVFSSEVARDRYIGDALERIQIVLRLMRQIGIGRDSHVLELGANPYLMTLMIRRYLDPQLSLANYFGTDRAEITAVDSVMLDGARMEMPYWHFNIERDDFPFQDNCFDAVLFCEILEHLLLDPDRVVAQIARVTKAGGHVIVSTPNATRLPNLFFLAAGTSIWEWYSPNGPYGRHNREFTAVEIQDLLRRHGFEIVAVEVRNLQALARRYTWLQWMRPTIWYEHNFVVGRKS